MRTTSHAFTQTVGAERVSNAHRFTCPPRNTLQNRSSWQRRPTSCLGICTSSGTRRTHRKREITWTWRPLRSQARGRGPAWTLRVPAVPRNRVCSISPFFVNIGTDSIDSIIFMTVSLFNMVFSETYDIQIFQIHKGHLLLDKNLLF